MKLSIGTAIALVIAIAGGAWTMRGEIAGIYAVMATKAELKQVELYAEADRECIKVKFEIERVLGRIREIEDRHGRNGVTEPIPGPDKRRYDELVDELNEYRRYRKKVCKGMQ